MKAYRKLLAIVVILSAATSASAQSTDTRAAPEIDPTAPAEETTGWDSFPNERHVMVRLLGGSSLRLNDSYGAGQPGPPWFLLEGHYLFKTFGSIRTGPSIGFQLGIAEHLAPQYALQPGWIAIFRNSRRWAFTARVDLPIMLTSGSTQTMSVTFPSFPGSPILAPSTRTYDIGFGIEAGIGAAFFLTSSIAVTAEIQGDLYFGNSAYTFPMIGAGLGVLVDYELFP